jgi:hypothetical protein
VDVEDNTACTFKVGEYVGEKGNLCVASRKLEDTGYQHGHKTGWCISKGFDRYDDKSNLCLRHCPSNEKRIGIKELGYKDSDGHKHDYCVKKGYRSYRPAPAGDYYPWGYCYK